jgi:hypothetical protein
MKLWKLLIPALVLALGSCDRPGSGPAGEVVARAAGFQLTSETAAQILAPHEQLPNQPEVVEALANLWVDYFLLARAVARDTTLQILDMSPILQRQIEQELVLNLRDHVIQVDTAISDNELQELYEAQLPGGRVRARHILLQYPPSATQPQIDSVQALAESLRARLVAGGSFEELAREYSQDPGSASAGGDLGTFGRGEMVPAFEEVVFAMDVGDISEVVETTFGLHLIQLDEKVIPPLDDLRDQFRAQAQERRVQVAESTFVANVVEAADIQVEDDSYEAVKQIASNPNMELTRRAAERPLVRYEGGVFTLGEFQEWLQTSAGNVAAQVEAAPDSQIEVLLSNLTRSELLVNEARKEGIEVPAIRQDSLVAAVREGVTGVARELGFLDMEMREGESADEAAARVVLEILDDVVRGERQVFPLGTVAFAMRKQFGARIHQHAFEGTVKRIEELRTQQPPPAPSSEPMPLTPPDTSDPGDDPDGADLPGSPTDAGQPPDQNGTAPATTGS